MRNLLAIALCTALLAGCDSVGPGDLEDVPDAATAMQAAAAPPATVGAPGSAFRQKNLDGNGNRSVREVCSGRRTERLILSRSDGYQFIVQFADGREKSYALGLRELGGRRVVLNLYKLSVTDPLVLQKDPVPAHFVERISLTPGRPLAVYEIDQTLLWSGATAHRNVSEGGVTVFTQPIPPPLPAKDRVGDDDQEVPANVFICRVPDLLGAIDLTIGG